MTFIEAIKKAYEKACDLKSKNTEGYSGYVTIHCGIYSLNVYAYGGVDFDLSGCSVDDLTGDYWKLVELVKQNGLIMIMNVFSKLKICVTFAC